MATPGGLGALGLVLLVFSVLGEPTLALLGALAVLLAWAGWRLLRPGRDGVLAATAPAPAFAWLLAAYAVLILLAVELIYLRDVFGSRMNTVFKFHYHAWIILGLAAAATYGLLLGRRGAHQARTVPQPGAAPGLGGRVAAALLLALALAGGLVYPLAATWTKSGEFRGEPTLDGERFLRRNTPADWAAITWLREHVPGRPVVVEAVGGSYQEFARVSVFSGLPTVVGWIGHEQQWRGDRPDYAQRERDVDAMYRASSREEIERLARRYDARYLFFGSLERAKYGPEAQSRLDGLLPAAYNRGGTTIYSLTGEGDGRR